MKKNKQKGDSSKKKSDSQKPISNTLLIGIGIFIVLLAVGIFMLYSGNGEDFEATQEDMEDFSGQDAIQEQGITDIPEDEVVATVDGEEITGGDIAEMQESVMAQGAQLSEEEAVEQLIMTGLLVQEAKDEGYSATKEDVEEEFESMLQMQGATLDDFKQQLEMQGLSYDEIIEQNKENIIIGDFIEGKIEDIPQVSDEEVDQTYEQMQGQPGMEDVTREDIRGMIEQQMQQQAQQEILMPLIQELEEKAEIEYLVDLEGPEQPEGQTIEIDPEDFE